MSDAECWKLNRMRQLEDENIRLLKENAELKARLVETPEQKPDGYMVKFLDVDGNLGWVSRDKNEAETAKIIEALFGQERPAEVFPVKIVRLDDPKPQGEE